jgi:N-acetylglucosaminyldiphosphoundecaprenol N-acetyl-beta-D-mannosaminyltransferase
LACFSQHFFPAVDEVTKTSLLGVRLAKVSIAEAVASARNGGLVLAPSGPGLCDLETDRHYRDALLAADLNLPDSGLAILLMRLLGLGRLPRTSGLGFLEAVLELPELKKNHASFWVMPSQAALHLNLQWLASRGLGIGEEDCYVAPIYSKTGEVSDQRLLAALEARRPLFIFICTGSGTQEKLGHWLKDNLSHRPAICCIGAAIGFLSGEQVRIPMWADRVCIGWLLRCLSDPRRFVPRYLRATRLFWLILRYGKNAPPLRGQ